MLHWSLLPTCVCKKRQRHVVALLQAGNRLLRSRLVAANPDKSDGERWHPGVGAARVGRKANAWDLTFSPGPLFRCYPNLVVAKYCCPPFSQAL
jgi:hypothetical protein